MGRPAEPDGGDGPSTWLDLQNARAGPLIRARGTNLLFAMHDAPPVAHVHHCTNRCHARPRCAANVGTQSPCCWRAAEHLPGWVTARGARAGGRVSSKSWAGVNSLCYRQHWACTGLISPANSCGNLPAKELAHAVMLNFRTTTLGARPTARSSPRAQSSGNSWRPPRALRGGPPAPISVSAGRANPLPTALPLPPAAQALCPVAAASLRGLPGRPIIGVASRAVAGLGVASV